MSSILFPISYSLISIALLSGFFRLFAGPDTLNRIVGFEMICISAIAVLTVHALQTESVHCLDIILIFSLLGFTSTVVFVDTLFRRPKEKGERR